MHVRPFLHERAPPSMCRPVPLSRVANSVLMTFILVVHTVLAIALVAVILMQKSEGGGFTGGGSSGGLVSARGAGDLLTRTTSILAALFIVTSLGLAWMASHGSGPRTIDTSLAREAPATPAALPAAPADNAAPAPANGTASPADSVPVAD